jgi:copper chaperone
MKTMKVPDMTCGHCAGVVTSAVKALDPDAEVIVKVMTREVSVQSRVSDDKILAALSNAGFPAQM